MRFALAGDDLAALARDVIADAANPPAALAVTWGTLAASDVVPAQLPRARRGAGDARRRARRAAEGRERARARRRVRARRRSAPARAPAGATTPRGPLARRWARLELDELIAAGNPRAITDARAAYGLVSPFTSMVAIGDEVVVPGGVKHTRGVPVSVPAGMHWQPVKHETTVELDGTSEVARGRQGAEPEARRSRRPRRSQTSKNREPRRRSRRPRPTKPQPSEVYEVDADHRDRPTKADARRATTNDEAPRHENEEAASDGRRFRRRTGCRASRGPHRSTAPATRATRARSRRWPKKTSSSTGTSSYERGRACASISRSAAVPRSSTATARSSRRRGSASSAAARTLFGGEARCGCRRHHGRGHRARHVSRADRAATSSSAAASASTSRPAASAPRSMLGCATSCRVPLRLYLRYDGALLFHDGTRDGQNTATFGISAHF